MPDPGPASTLPARPPSAPGAPIWYVYLLRCADDSLYCGITTDLERRVAEHARGAGARYTRSRLPVELVWVEEAKDRSAAASREWRIKALDRERKEALVQGSGAGLRSGRPPGS